MILFDGAADVVHTFAGRFFLRNPIFALRARWYNHAWAAGTVKMFLR
ncbi:MAG: hypothetical protein HC909_01440 [Blastochloris sp.]|nr:hypothetical protein [Blastochloris sp.]